MPRVLVGDMDGMALVPGLVARGFEVREAADGDAAESVMRAFAPDLVILDGHLARGGMLVRSLQRIDTRATIVVMTSDTDAAIDADHTFAKPIEITALLNKVQKLLETQRTRRLAMAINVREQRHGIDPFTGTSAVIQELADQAHRVLDSHAPILIQGETGTGKGVLASWLHHHGPRAEEPLVDINCAGLSRELVESELFGHERGSFTGAVSTKLGLLDVAHRGTVFLDEIGEIDLLLQPRLLKVVEEKRFRRVGDVRDHVVDIRLLAATNRDLARRARAGTFRADLYYRISTIALTIPPLRQRREDIPLLARLIANGFGLDLEFAPDALRALQAYEWRGNVRELRNVIERAILLSNRAPRICEGDLRFETPASEEDDEIPGTLVDAERRHIERVLRHEQGSVERAAQRLGVSRSTLYQKLRRFKAG